MNTARFDTDRRRIGLSIADVAEIAGVQERNARGWCAGRRDPPDDVLAEIHRIEDLMQQWVDAFVALAESRTMAGPLVLRRYNDRASLEASLDEIDLPLNAHAMMIAWASDALAQRGIDAVINWVD